MKTANKTTYKTALTLKPYTVKAFGYEITVPAGSTVSNKTACGNDDSYRFWNDWQQYAEKLTGFKNSILSHDLTHYGLNVPAEYCTPYGETPKLSRYAHGGAGSTLLPWPEGQRRTEAMADGLRQLAERHGIKFREPLHPNANGEFSLVVEGSKPGETGHYGEAVAALIAKHGSRTGVIGYGYHNHRAASDGWCWMNHFAVQRMLEDAEGFQP